MNTRGLSQAAFYERMLLVKLKRKISRERLKSKKRGEEALSSNDTAEISLACGETAGLLIAGMIIDAELAKYPKPLPLVKKERKR